ncbi:ATP-dependent zinc metalloprotease FtsH [Clostridium sp. 'deep sea']|uniref:ATP-dependent zinc metalloprotease FtsH n=1 Tax=Clostridium sp. 'deep sea' TaxID=2779445 RepID=UPI0018968089|nr:ATP-dependent zinc metalloprotease FtsH [Clostridium sp. 'deep sea']QOR34526.1 ATP-dependent zinc metalloprotease FtsH [Clostridium sp. 'deep sea']
MNKRVRAASVYILLIIIALSLISYFSNGDDQIAKPDINTFQKQVESGMVKSLVVEGNNGKGEYADGAKFEIFLPAEDEELRQLMKAHIPDLKYRPVPTAPWWTALLTYLIPFALILGIWFFFFNQTQGGGNRAMSFGKSRAKLHEQNRKQVTFDDVAGYEEVKEELIEIVEFLKDSRRFIQMGARIPKGVLLFGPPGTGKTFLARAVAGEAKVPFFSISGSDFVEMFVGVGASRVRDMFENAKKSAPCILFIDEIDAVGRHRGAGLGGGHDEREQTLNQLLVEMDGFEMTERVIVMAATNRPDILDPALLRPGRFDRQVVVGKPNIKEREAILKIHSRGKPLSDDVDLEILARSTPGFTAADLENLLNEGALFAARYHKNLIEMVDLEEAINRVLAGPAKKARVDSKKSRRIAAYHEAGHALVGHYMPHMDPIHTVTIIPRGAAGGFTAALPKEDTFFYSRTEMLERIAFALGGRIAEAIIFDDITTGASNDIKQVSAIARSMVTEYGMSEKLGPIAFGHRSGEVFLGRDIAKDPNYSDDIAALIDDEVHKLIEVGYKQAEKVLQDHIDELHAVAKELLDKETLKAEQFGELVGERPQIQNKYLQD